MAFLGYALFTGQYGEFTVPVFSAPGFSIGSEPLTGYTMKITDATFNSISWNTANSIYGLVVDPERTTPSKAPTYTKVFEAISSPVVGITCTDSTATVSGADWPDDYYPRINIWVNEVRTGWWPAYKPTGTPGAGNVYVEPVPCIFLLDDGKYYPEVSRTTVREGDGVSAEFIFGSRYDTTYYTLDSIKIQQTPVLIGANPPIRISTDPEYDYFYEKFDSSNIPEYVDRVFLNLYVERGNGSKIPVSPDDVLLSIEGTNSVSDARLVANTYNDYGIHSLVVLYDRQIEIPESRWFFRFVLKSDESVVGKLEMRTIRLTSNIYDPGFGGGVDSGAVGPGPNGSFGGGGDFGIDPSTGRPVQSDDVATSLPSAGSYEGSISNAGLFVHYAMNAGMLKIVGDWLWADDLGLIIAKEFLSILYGSPIESAISLMSYPFNVTALPGVTSQMQQMYWGAHAIGETLGGVKALAVTNPYATIDWGTVQLTEFWGNFLDYAPHTKLELYLPWCTGFVPIDPNECLPGSLRVVTNIELAKGTCLHNVIGNDGRVIATHSGTCGKQLPLTALDTSGKALALVSGAAMTATVGGMALMGGTAGAMYGGFDVAKLQGPYGQRWVPYDKPGNVSTAFEGAKTGAGMAAKASKKPAVMAAAAALRANVTVPRNGTFTGTTAGLGVQYPYLIISRPTQSVPKQYGHHYGYPSNIYSPLLTLRGYTEIGEIHLTGFTCTEDELTEIDSLLKSGVIL